MSSIQEKESDCVTVAAGVAIRSRMEIGSAKYSPSAWRDESARRHVRKAIRHAVTALEIADGDRLDDGENHLAAAILRNDDGDDGEESTWT